MFGTTEIVTDCHNMLAGVSAHVCESSVARVGQWWSKASCREFERLGLCVDIGPKSERNVGMAAKLNAKRGP